MYKYLLLLSSLLISLLLFNNAFSQEVSAESTRRDTYSISDESTKIKNEAQHNIKTTDRAIREDLKQIKEQVPKDFKKAKDDVVNASKELKQNATHEIKEIHDGLKKTVK